MGVISLETDRLVLRDYLPEDEADYVALKMDEKVMYYLPDIRIKSQAQGAKDFQGVRKDQESSRRRFYFLHIMEKETGRQVGTVGYTVEQVTPFGKLVGAGYFSYPAFWGKGYMTEAFARVLAYGMEENGVYRLSTGCLKENRGSESVMKKCGLVKEAEHLHAVFHDGKMKTRVEYRMLREDWEKQKRRMVLQARQKTAGASVEKIVF